MGDITKPQLRAPFRIKVLHHLRIILAHIMRFLCSIYYGNETEKIPPISDPILKLPAIEVARKIRHKEISSVEVLEACIRRIKEINTTLNCLIEDRFELAHKEAQAADELIRSGTKTIEQLEKEKPFLGVPFTTKDSVKVKGLHCCSAVVRYKDNVADINAKPIELLIDAGAIIIGITNVPELCLWIETYNKIYGTTKNPHNTTRIPGGSSGGEGCIQASGGSIFGIGTDIAGSIRMPAHFNGIFGHKPTRFIVSNEGQFPEDEPEIEGYLLGTGPITKHAVDLKPIMKVISGDNRKKLDLDKPVDLTKLKIYYQFCSHEALVDPVDPEIISAIKKVIEYFNVKYQLKAKETRIDLLRKSTTIWFSNMKTEESLAYFIMSDGSFWSLCKEIVKCIMGFSANSFVILVTALGDYTGIKFNSEEYKRNLKKREELEKEFKDILDDDGVFFYPVHPTTAPYHNEPLSRPMNIGYTAAINLVGMPATSIPLGLSSEGLPFGMQVVANHNNDRLCLAVAEELEKAFGGWIEPQIS